MSLGVFVVTAAGNNYDNLPTRNIVYPARFKRVVAACGVMADHTPYADLAPRLMAGNYGPDDKMATAIAASTPNTPWARMGCPTIDRSRRLWNVVGDAAGRRGGRIMDAGQSRRLRRLSCGLDARRSRPQSAIPVGGGERQGETPARLGRTEGARGARCPAGKRRLASQASRRLRRISVSRHADRRRPRRGFGSAAAHDATRGAAIVANPRQWKSVLAGISRPEQMTAKDKLDLAEALLSRPGISCRPSRQRCKPRTARRRRHGSRRKGQTRWRRSISRTRSLRRSRRRSAGGCASSQSIRP